MEVYDDIHVKKVILHMQGFKCNNGTILPMHSSLNLMELELFINSYDTSFAYSIGLAIGMLIHDVFLPCLYMYNRFLDKAFLAK